MAPPTRLSWQAVVGRTGSWVVDLALSFRVLGLLAAGFDQRFGARPHLDPKDSTNLMPDAARSPSMEILAIQSSLRQRRRSA